jgi:hypothetical protein
MPGSFYMKVWHIMDFPFLPMSRCWEKAREESHGSAEKMKASF